ncbi:hypothetical protein CLOBOL_05345 [Enterocloster bolteae ATCC BAA-613]|uniref:Uncharacterized protein n=1 Tax=Enterocloster bolteae (strain ATCC BAA-613 / DSM 15670 / CCUG 46953 / JCM 12243 / WAL 16351) TaxID=411902 RepID=A8RZ75_ENTBW|nr:hypothetical protein CLOBOL_05345 [Enterocloster bolteae ATCC BAA-613]
MCAMVHGTGICADRLVLRQVPYSKETAAMAASHSRICD